MLNKFGQILLANSILRQDVEQDDSDLIVDGDILIQEDRNDVLHVIFYFLSLGISPHGKILLHFAEFVNVALVVLHALLGQVEVGGELGQLLRSKKLNKSQQRYSNKMTVLPSGAGASS